MIKKIISAIILVLFVHFGFAQNNITAIEYFFDSDPGVGNGIAISVPTPNDTIQINTNISVAGVAPGFHYMYLRARNDSNVWNVIDAQMFYVIDTANTASDITYLENIASEYFIDTDPGVGNGIDIPITPGDTVHAIASIPMSGYSPGFHHLYIRTLTSDFTWSITEELRFYLYDTAGFAAPTDFTNITGLEYFIDSDPGPGNGIDIPVTPGDTVTVSTTVPTTGYAPGFHNLFVRAKTSDNLWNTVQHHLFYIRDTVVLAPLAYNTNTEIEYFYDIDPGVGNGIDIPIPDGDTLNTITSLPTTGLSPWFHNLFVRAKNDGGLWNVIETRPLFIFPPAPALVAQITEIEYFFDNDPGVGMATKLIVPSLPSDSSVISQSIVVPCLTAGAHFMYIRAKNDLGVWNVIDVDTINVDTTMISQPIFFTGLDTVCFPNTIGMYADSAAGIAYQWLESGVPIAGATNAIFYADSSGNYSLQQSCLGQSNTSNSLDAIVNYVPTITFCPPDVFINNDPGNCSAIVVYPPATAIGSVPPPVITYSQNSGTVFPVGITTVYVVATNECGTDSCSFDVTVTDNENPIIACPANITQTADSAQCGAIVNFAATATDNCAVDSISYSQYPGTFFPVGTTNVTATAVDIHGNASNCSFDVTVTDNENPIIACPANITQTADSAQCGAIVNFAATATDNCAVDSISYSQYPGTFFPVGTTNVTATAVDIHGNASNCSFDVTVTDNENPIIACPANITQTADSAQCGAIVNFAATATDNCAVDSISYSQNPGTFFPVGTTNVTATAVDIHGNASNCSFDVTVTDDENPIISCPANITQTADSAQCGAIVNFAATATDNCAVDSISYSQNPGTFFPVGTTNVTATAVDIHGNASNCSFDVTVTDDENPIISCPANITQTADSAQCGAIVNFAATATDNCAVDSISYSQNPGTFFPVGTTNVTATAVDIHGNASNCSFDVTVTDDENPIIACPANITQTADSAQCGAIVNFAATATDNCAVDSISYSQNPGTFFPVGTTNVTATAVDIHGNASNCSFDVTVTDDENPIIACPANITQTADSAQCGAIVNFAATATDNCAVDSISYSQNPGTFFPVGTTNVTATAVDIHGNASNCSFDVTVTDNENPIIACPANITQTADSAQCGAIVNFAATATDNCAVDSISYSQNPGTFFPVGTTNVTATAVDIYGNASNCSFDVTVTDDENPIIACPANITQTADSAQCGAIVNFAATATDNCAVDSISYSQNPGTFFPVGTTNVTATAVDIHGNSSNCSFDVTVTDDENPIIACPANITQTADSAQCGAIVNFAATATDNCAVDSISYSQNPGTFFPVGTTNVTATAVDIHGNTSNCSFTVTVTDNENPIISCPANITQTADSAQCGAIVNFAATATDNCAVDSISYSQYPGTFFPVGTTNVTATAVDIHGNASNCSFDVTVTDNENPIIACPANITQTADSAQCGAIVNFAATATDNCAVDSISYSQNPGTFFPVGTTNVTATAVDIHGNASNCSFDVTVTDDENPIIACPANITQTADSAQCGAIVNFAATANDNCAVDSISYSQNPGTFFPVGTTNVTTTAVDIHGNISNCSFDVTVTDDENPIVACPANITQTADSAQCGAIVNFAATATDNCAVDSISYSQNPGTFFPVGTTNVTATAVDIHGNASNCSFDVTVTDDENPIIACPANITQTADSAQCGAIVNFAVTATDNCAVDSISYSQNPGTFFPVGTTNVTATAVDIHGNASNCSFDVTVTDDALPKIICPGNIVANNDSGSCGSVVNYVIFHDDNCPGDSITQTAGLPSGSLFPVGVTTNTFVVFDASGNSDSCSFTVTINDTELPTIICPPTATLQTDSGSTTASGPIGNPTVSDNCAVASTSVSDPGPYPVGTTTVIWTVIDVNGNSATCSQDVNVSPSCTAPALTCPANIVVAADSGACNVVVTFAATATGTSPVITFSPASGSTFPVGVTNVTAIATNACGSDTCSFSVTVNDNEPPTITCPPAISLLTDSGSTTASGPIGNPTVSDNCAVASTSVSDPGPYPIGITTVIWTVIDVNGNSATCSQDVNVSPSCTAPALTCPANIVVAADSGACNVVVTFAATATGTSPVITFSPASGSTFPVGVTNVTAIATNACGSDTCSFSVTVNDNEPPTITCPPAISLLTDSGSTTASGPIGNPTVSDNCAVASTSVSDPGPYPIGITTVIWTVIDVNGNSATCSQDVNVSPSCTPPALTCPANIVVAADSGACNAVVTFAATATGTSPVITFSPASGSTFPVGVTNVTAIATNACGSDTCSFSVTVNDNEPPTITCPPTISLLTDSGSTTASGPIGNPTVSDNCAVASTNVSDPGPYPVGTTTVIWTVIDVNGNSATCSQDVNVSPSCTAPTLTCPANIVVAADSGACSAVVTFAATATGTSPVITFSPASGSSFPVGVTNVTAIATNACGSDTCSFSVTVSDNEPPTITCPPAISLLTDSGATTASGPIGNPTVSDNCAVASTSVSDPGPYPVGTTTVIWTVIDVNGNSATCSQDVNVSPSCTAPALTCPANIVVAADSGACNVVVTFAATATGTSPAITFSPASGSTFPVGVTNVTAIATNACGSDTCSFSVTVNDNEPPTITCPPAISLLTDSGSTTASGPIGNPTVSDNCAVASTSVSDPGPYPIGITTVIWTVIDVNGNSATCSQDVNVSPSCTAPTLTCPANIVVAADSGACNAVVTFAATATGTSPVITFSPASGSTFPVGVTNVTAIATNACGSDTCSFSVTVNDNEPPTITCPPAISLLTDSGSTTASGPIGNPTVSDNCAVASTSVSDPGPYPIGITTVIWTVIDVNGNSATCSQDVNVSPSCTAPTLTCPANIAVATDFAACNAVVTFAATATGTTPSITFSPASGSTFPVGVTNVTAIATNACGSDTCSFSVTVNDIEPPAITCPPNVTLLSDIGTNTASGPIGTPITSDNCAVASTSVSNPGPYPVGITNVIWTVIDVNGNSATCSQDVNVSPSCTPPVITCPTNIVVATDFAACNAVVTFAATATGTSPSITFSPASGSTFPVGVTNVMAIATNACGSDTCSFSVTVNDIDPPAITCPPNVTLLTDIGTNTASGPIGTPITSDNCTVASTSVSDPGPYPVGITNVIWTVIDVNGNSATCSQDVEVTNQTCNPPVITITSADAIVCQGNSTTVNVSASGGFPPYVGTGTFTVFAGTSTYTVTDAIGCTATASITISENVLNGTVQHQILYNGEQVSCAGATDAIVEIQPVSFIITQGMPPMPSAGPFEYAIDNGPTQNSNIFSGLGAGTYNLSVTDLSTGCTAIISHTITDPAPLNVTVNINNQVSCQGQTNGSATASATGGTGVYTYSWNTPIPKQTPTNNEIPAGTWTVTVTDENGCISTATVTIGVAANLTTSLGDDQIVLYGAFGYNGCTTLNATTTGGVIPYASYSWTSTNPAFVPITTVVPSITICNTSETTYTYTVVVTDAGGCTASSQVLIQFVNIDCSNNQNTTKVKICNVPPGNPQNCKTICINVSAAPALLATGSYLGKCKPNCAPPAKSINAPTYSHNIGDELVLLKVYPNPTSGMLNIQFSSEYYNAESIVITDVVGRSLYQLKGNDEPYFETELNIAEFEEGIYFINFYQNGMVVKSARVIKLK